MKVSSKEHLLGVAGVLVAAVLWGTTGVSATFAPEVGAAAIGAAAMGVGGLLQTAIATRAIARHAAALSLQWRWLLLGALAVTIYPLAFYGSMRLAGVTVGTVVSIGSAPLLSAVIEMVMDGLRVSARWVIGAGLGLVGLTYALYSWAARRLMQRRIPSRAAMGAIFGIGGLLLIPVLFATGAPFLASWNNAAVGIYMALVPMFLGYVCFGYGLARIAASTATTITLLEPVVAAALAAVIVGERLPAMGWVGVALIFACLVCITLPVRARSRTNPVPSTNPA